MEQPSLKRNTGTNAGLVLGCTEMTLVIQNDTVDVSVIFTKEDIAVGHILKDDEP